MQDRWFSLSALFAVLTMPCFLFPLNCISLSMFSSALFLYLCSFSPHLLNPMLYFLSLLLLLSITISLLFLCHFSSPCLHCPLFSCGKKVLSENQIMKEAKFSHCHEWEHGGKIRLLSFPPDMLESSHLLCSRFSVILLRHLLLIYLSFLFDAAFHLTWRWMFLTPDQKVLSQCL